MPKNKQDLVDHGVKKTFEKVETSIGLKVKNSEAKSQKTPDSLDLTEQDKSLRSHSVELRCDPTWYCCQKPKALGPKFA